MYRIRNFFKQTYLTISQLLVVVAAGGGATGNGEDSTEVCLPERSLKHSITGNSCVLYKTIFAWLVYMISRIDSFLLTLYILKSATAHE